MPVTTRSTVTKTICALAILVSFGLSTASAQEDAKPASEMTIKEIMKAAHKKAEGASASLLTMVVKGEAAEADQQRLLELYKSMAAQEAPVGDAESWTELNGLLVSATEAIISGEEGAGKKLKKASGCMKCHKEHKPE